MRLALSANSQVARLATLNFIKSSSCFFAEADEWRRLCGRSASSALLIVDGQSVKNTDTAALKCYEAGKKASGIKRPLQWTPKGGRTLLR